MEKAAEIGHELKPNTYLDQGVPGRYNASHAEKQLSIVSDGPIAVSRSMCPDCQGYFQKLAGSTGKSYTVGDPDVIREFRPDGTIAARTK
jgi:hypothetical protein